MWIFRGRDTLEIHWIEDSRFSHKQTQCSQDVITLDLFCKLLSSELKKKKNKNSRGTDQVCFLKS